MLTAAVTRFHSRQGRCVRVFKTGPDFLDPMVLARASGAPVFQLDLWMGGEDHCQQLLASAAATADLILIEGVMGVYDGTPSSADLASLFELPLLAVIDANAMAQTFAALAEGLVAHRSDITWMCVVGNRVAGDYHERLLSEHMHANILLATFPHDSSCCLPERHLGLLQASEVNDLDQRLDRLADKIVDSKLALLPPTVEFSCAATERETFSCALKGVTIGVASDTAFSFIYPANLQCLRDMGASLVFFFTID